MAIPKQTKPTYASDTRPSMPRAPKVAANDNRIPMFGFVFTSQGLFHDITDEGVSQVSNPFLDPDRDT